MQGQEPGTNLFCIYRDCEDLALFGDYCKVHQFQRAEAAEARAAQAESERDELARKLEQARNREQMDRAVMTEASAKIDELRQEARDSAGRVVTLMAELEQVQRKIGTYDNADRALNQALNEGDGVYRP